MSSTLSQKAIDRFVAYLWQYMRQQAVGASQDNLKQILKLMHAELKLIDPKEQYIEIGEALAAHIINYTVKQYSRKNCIICEKFVGCPDVASGPCEKYQKDELAYRSGRALVADAVFRLDRVFGIDAQQMLTLIVRYLEEMENNDEDG